MSYGSLTWEAITSEPARRQTSSTFRRLVAIAIGVRASQPAPDTSATVRYAKVEGVTRDDKLAKLDAIAKFNEIEWRNCPSDRHKPFLPYWEWGAISNGRLFTDLFPYQRSGSKFGRPWPIGETPQLLQDRWSKMLSETGQKRADLFKNNKYRKIERRYRDHITGDFLPPLENLIKDASCPEISPYAFRSFDRHWAIEDIRLNDRMGEVLWQVNGDNQLFLTSLATTPLGEGQAIIASASVPDLHYFCGRGG